MSMPFIGLSPFLRKLGKVGLALKKQCQCPLSGFLHFYVCEYLQVQPSEISVNALYRAFSISTTGIDIPMELLEGVSMPFIGLSPFLRSPLRTP